MQRFAKPYNRKVDWVRLPGSRPWRVPLGWLATGFETQGCVMSAWSSTPPPSSTQAKRIRLAAPDCKSGILRDRCSFESNRLHHFLLAIMQAS